MDETAPDIVFDENGRCNFCRDFEKRLVNLIAGGKTTNKFEKLIKEIKQKGKGKKYDCIVGVSGGVDSTYVLHLVKEAGLRPLAVHLDNGWNSELAVSNIHAIISKLGIDLHTHVIDWNENREMQMSMLKADVIDVELLMDNAMTALNYKMAAKYKVKYILAGTNLTTEGITMPRGWNHFKYDAKNIKSIHKIFSGKPIKTHPLFGVLDFCRYRFINAVKWTSILDYINYNKNEALKLLINKYSYKPYPYKHYESVFTRYYQGHILPRKFGIDKRRVHLSALIISKQLTRQEALDDLAKPPYAKDQLERDQALILKKFNLTEVALNEYLSSPPKDHREYPSELWLWNILVAIRNKIQKLSLFVSKHSATSK